MAAGAAAAEEVKRPRGRPKGSLNRKTVKKKRKVAKQAKQGPAAKAEPWAGDPEFELFDAHETLMRIYQNKRTPITARIKAASAAMRFERPAVTPAPQKTEHNYDDSETEFSREIAEVRAKLAAASRRAAEAN